MLLLEDTLRRTTFALGTAATIALAAGAAALPAIAGHDLVPVEPTALQAPDPAGATEALQTPTRALGLFTSNRTPTDTCSPPHAPKTNRWQSVAGARSLPDQQPGTYAREGQNSAEADDSAQ